MDYNADIPFEHIPAAGFYDTTEEINQNHTEKQAFDHRTRQSGARRKDTEDPNASHKRRPKDESKEAEAAERQAMARAERLQRLQEAEQISKRRKLALPAPQTNNVGTSVLAITDVEETPAIGESEFDIKSLLKSGFNSLPKPKNDFDLVAPEEEDEQEEPEKPAKKVAVTETVRAEPKEVEATENNQIALHKSIFDSGTGSRALAERRANMTQIKPEWHAPWKLMRVISGHLGWVRSVCVEPDNQWFATGAGDRTIKIWDLASGTLKTTLTGHIMTVRGLAVSPRHPYMFSCGEDKMVKCWDLEQNKVIRHYHGHLSGVYAMDLHPNLDVLVTAGRDAVVRVWDMRTRMAVHVLSGHKGTISSVKCQEADPQIISGSMDAQVRLWDLAAGKTQTVLTHHKKSVRALTMHPTEFTFASGSADNIKQWKLPEGSFMHNYQPQHNAIVNTLSTNSDGVMFSGGDNGSMALFDWKTGRKFQDIETTAVPGSLDSENGIFASTFDHTGLRLITCEADKSIKMWREDPDATPETHPGIDYQPTLQRW
ncbi:WD40-repeat-containing domain protein [Lipomyces arxii]|uniref:WD40-repeat-containing domain protein n=1 Tax=Lipomyces arxii TaxID=56418 RepID=UPI0034CDE822